MSFFFLLLSALALKAKMFKDHCTSASFHSTNKSIKSKVFEKLNLIHTSYAMPILIINLGSLKSKISRNLNICFMSLNVYLDKRKGAVSGSSATESLEHHYQQSKHWTINTNKMTYVGQTVPLVLTDVALDNASDTREGRVGKSDWA